MQPFVYREFSRPLIVATIMVVALILASLDYLTGYEVSFAVFYSIPVVMAGWFLGTYRTMLVALSCALLWEAANLLAGETYSEPWIPWWNTATRLLFFIIIGYLISRLRVVMVQLRELALNDSLTAVANRRYFYIVLKAEVARARRNGNPLTLLYIDLDNFKFVNDRYGHKTGDELLRRVATAMSVNVRENDTVARLGGDEFAVLMPETGEDAAGKASAKLQGLLLEEMEKNGWPVSFSIGAVTAASIPDEAEKLIARADELMYNVKKAGKNNIAHEVFS